MFTVFNCFFQILNVDLNYIEAKISELLKFDKSLLLVQGFLMSRWKYIFCYHGDNIAITPQNVP